MDDFKNLFYYIVVSVLAGLVAEFNEDSKSPTARDLFVRGFTSVVIGITVGLIMQEFTHNVPLSIAACSLASVSGYPSLTFMRKAFRRYVNDRIKHK